MSNSSQLMLSPEIGRNVNYMSIVYTMYPPCHAVVNNGDFFAMPICYIVQRTLISQKLIKELSEYGSQVFEFLCNTIWQSQLLWSIKTLHYWIGIYICWHHHGNINHILPLSHTPFTNAQFYLSHAPFTNAESPIITPCWISWLCHLA